MKYEDRVFVKKPIWRKDQLWVPAGEYKGRRFNGRWLIWIMRDVCTVLSKEDLEG